VVLAVATLVSIWLPRRWRALPSERRTECLFTSIYILFFLTFNSPEYIDDQFQRFLLPAFPLFLFALRDWIPHDRRVLWAAAVLAALLTSAHVVGFRNVFGFKLP
jgi:hypothetical protein